MQVSKVNLKYKVNDTKTSFIPLELNCDRIRLRGYADCQDQKVELDWSIPESNCVKELTIMYQNETKVVKLDETAMGHEIPLATLNNFKRPSFLLKVTKDGRTCEKNLKLKLNC